MSEWKKEEIEKTLLQVKKKAMQDADFRKLSLTDPEAAIKEITGKDLPEDFKLKFVENDGVNMTIVLPDMISHEMSEDELEKAVGGALREVFLREIF